MPGPRRGHPEEAVRAEEPSDVRRSPAAGKPANDFDLVGQFYRDTRGLVRRRPIVIQELHKEDHETKRIQSRQPLHQPTALIRAARSSSVSVPWYPQTNDW